MPSLIEVYGSLKVYPMRLNHAVAQICAEIDKEKFLFGPFLCNHSYGICRAAEKYHGGDATQTYGGDTTGVLFDGKVISRIYRYTHAELLKEFERRAKVQFAPFPLPHASLFAYYGEGYYAYANDTTGYIMMAYDVLHIFTKKQGNYPEKLYPLPIQDTYHADKDGRLVILTKDAMERVRSLDAGIFADPFVWLVNESTNTKRTMVFEGTPVLPQEETQDG
jgi:hypothetical protein